MPYVQPEGTSPKSLRYQRSAGILVVGLTHKFTLTEGCLDFSCGSVNRNFLLTMFLLTRLCYVCVARGTCVRRVCSCMRAHSAGRLRSTATVKRRRL